MTFLIFFTLLLLSMKVDRHWNTSFTIIGGTWEFTLNLPGAIFIVGLVWLIVFLILNLF